MKYNTKKYIEALFSAEKNNHPGPSFYNLDKEEQKEVFVLARALFPLMYPEQNSLDLSKWLSLCGAWLEFGNADPEMQPPPPNESLYWLRRLIDSYEKVEAQQDRIH